MNSEGHSLDFYYLASASWKYNVSAPTLAKAIWQWTFSFIYYLPKGSVIANVMQISTQLPQKTPLTSPCPTQSPTTKTLWLSSKPPPISFPDLYFRLPQKVNGRYSQLPTTSKSKARLESSWAYGAGFMKATRPLLNAIGWAHCLEYMKYLMKI